MKPDKKASSGRMGDQQTDHKSDRSDDPVGKEDTAGKTKQRDK